MAYEIMDHDVLRDGVKVAEFGADGTLLMSEGCDAYRLPAARAVREFLGESAPMREAEAGTEEKSRMIRTVSELIAAMQEFTSEACPPEENFYGDKTPAVQEWIQRHDDIRRNVLRMRNREV